MPIYAYICGSCAFRFEKLSREILPDPPGCPECGAETRRMPTAANFVLEGAGFYQTEYGSKSKNAKRNAK